MRYCGDWMFWIEIAMQGNVVNISRELNYFRQHISQTAKGKNKNKELKQALLDICNKELKTSMLADYYYFKIHLHFRFLPWVLTDKKDYRKAIISEI